MVGNGIERLHNGGFAVVILAAGSELRGGRPRLLTPYLGRTLIEHTVRTAIASKASEVIVVVEPSSHEIRAKLAGLPVRIVANHNSAEGLSSSIRTGVSQLQGRPSAVVVTLANRPGVTPALLRDLAQRGAAAGIAASAYGGIVGVPAAFAACRIPELLALSGPAGARDLIRSGAEPVETIQFELAAVKVNAERAKPHVIQTRPSSYLGGPTSSTEARAPPRAA